MTVTSNKSSHVSSVKEQVKDLIAGPELQSLNVSPVLTAPPQLMDDGHERQWEREEPGVDVTGMWPSDQPPSQPGTVRQSHSSQVINRKVSIIYIKCLVSPSAL